MFKTKEYVCRVCKNTFISRVRYDREVKFCSHKCSGVFKKGKPSWNKGKPAPWLIGNKHAKGLIPFNKGKRGLQKPWNFKGKYLAIDGYVRIFQPYHSNATGRGYVMEHRLVAEKYLGRFLKKEEIVHHINENRSDNRPENLFVFANMVLHLKCHRNKEIVKSNLCE